MSYCPSRRKLGWCYEWRNKINRKEQNLELSSNTSEKNIIGTKWVFRNKLDENGEITRNKARLVCEWYAQEGVDYGETFSPIARMEGVRTLLAYATYKGFKSLPNGC